MAAPEGRRGNLAKITALITGDDARSPVRSYSLRDSNGNWWAVNVTQQGHGLHFGYASRFRGRAGRYHWRGLGLETNNSWHFHLCR